MTRHDPTAWTREESRYVDSELDARAAEAVDARLERDPALLERVEGWHEVADLYREDVVRRAPAFDPRVMVDRVLRDGPSAVEPAGLRDARAARRYAVAALVLLGIGILGATWLGPQARVEESGIQATVRNLERERIDVAGDREWETFVPGLHAAGGER